MAPETTRPSSDDVDMHLNDDAESPSGKIPPRLASRFYRKTSAHRRTSAHSSRRSSLSSIHSRTSALSCHGGPQSTHIAQHLRRASIIESRKQRLAERAAHAEQVRLRAAAAKAASRPAYNEEKALAAQAAREKLLAEVAARCEEEVRRAKKVAEETKEKKAAEHARLRQEVAEKYAEAARRRSGCQTNARRPRRTSLAAVEERKVDPIQLRKLGRSAAAKVVQRAWRSWRLRKAAKAFVAAGVQIQDFAEMDFESVSRFIAEDSVITPSANMLKALKLLPTDVDLAAERGAVRVFLSAYMIVSHPEQALSHGGKADQESSLVGKSESLIKAMEADVQTYLNGGRMTRQLHDRLQFLYNDFSSSFHAWKSQDLTVLVDIMVSAFVNLDRIIQSTKDDRDGNVADDYLQAVRQEQIKLLARLKRLLPPEQALARVRTAVMKSRKEKARGQAQSSETHVPRATTPVELTMMDAITTMPLTPPATPSQAPRDLVEKQASAVARLESLLTTLPSNREIAHTMSVDGSYQVSPPSSSGSYQASYEYIKNLMRENTVNGGNAAVAHWTHALASMIREKLFTLVTEKHPLHARIDDFLDLRLIDQQCLRGMFSYDDFFATIAEIISKICSPGRDEAVQAFAENKEGDDVDRVFRLIGLIDLLTLDHVNFQYRMASKRMIERFPEYEFAHFQRDLESGEHTLERLQRFWATAKGNVVPTTPVSANIGNVIYARGLTDLVFSNSPMKFSSFPETLRLDYVRLVDVRARTFRIAAISSILLTSKIRLRRNRESLWKLEAERLMKLDLLQADPTRIVNLIETSHMMPHNTKEGLLDFVSRVIPSARAALSMGKTVEERQLAAHRAHKTFLPTGFEADREHGDVFSEQIATFILKSVREYVFTRLSAMTTAEKVRATSSAAEVLARAGMPEFVAEVAGIIGVLERVRHVDLKAHGKWYDEVSTGHGAGSSSRQ